MFIEVEPILVPELDVEQVIVKGFFRNIDDHRSLLQWKGFYVFLCLVRPELGPSLSVVGGPSGPLNYFIDDVADSSLVGSSARLLSFNVLVFLFLTTHIFITKILLIHLIPFLLIIMNNPTPFWRILIYHFLLLFGFGFFLWNILFSHFLFFLLLYFFLLCFLPQLSCFFLQLFCFIHQIFKILHPFQLKIVLLLREIHLPDVTENERVELAHSAFDV